MKWEPIDKESGLLFKGMAILMIVTHNFMHVFPHPRQNEFDFKREYFDSFLYLLWNESENIFRITASYFGHFGVQVFIFLSAYGLTKKYLNSVINYRQFIWSRITKIYPAFLLALLTWFILRILWNSLNDSLETTDFMINAVLLKVTLLSNFFSGYALKPVGPWWFFPFIIQFYIVYPAILKAFELWGLKSLFVISLLSLSIVFFLQTVEFGFYFTILPYLPEFCFGIYMAKYDDKGVRVFNILFVVLFVIFILGNLYKSFWYLSHFCALFLLITTFQFVRKFIQSTKIINNTFLFIGTISMQLFFVHGFLRTPLVEWAVADDRWFVVNIYCSIYILFSIITAFVLFKIEYRLRNAYIRCFK